MLLLLDAVWYKSWYRYINIFVCSRCSFGKWSGRKKNGKPKTINLKISFNRPTQWEWNRLWWSREHSDDGKSTVLPLPLHMHVNRASNISQLCRKMGNVLSDQHDQHTITWSFQWCNTPTIHSIYRRCRRLCAGIVYIVRIILQLLFSSFFALIFEMLCHTRNRNFTHTQTQASKQTNKQSTLNLMMKMRFDLYRFNRTILVCVWDCEFWLLFFCVFCF